MRMKVVICWKVTVDLSGTKSMRAADGILFTSAYAFVVAHLVLKSHSETVIGCSSKMKNGLPCRGRSRDLSAHSLTALANNDDVNMPANITQASAVVISIFGDDSSGEHASNNSLALLDQ